ncbi:interferon gamma receptor 2 [Talpa occidentalis]|uniref:interferon gamma receptor 2 n=1 Tax=Talpa occidentalis TaxID=50954 RepID=UPI0023F9C924|nr:interferon gamma receptor 2 [Talpa occidentalis]
MAAPAATLGTLQPGTLQPPPRPGRRSLPGAEDAPSQLPAPRNPKIRLYNTEQVLSWEPGTPDWDSRPVVYRVQLKYSSGWHDTHRYLPGVNCTRITITWCNFTGNEGGFSTHFNVHLRVRAELGDVVSAWATVPWFQHYRNVTVGPPGNIWVTPEENSFIITLSPPFDINISLATFHYFVRFWEKTATQQNEVLPAGKPQMKGPFQKNVIVLDGLKPATVYCLQVQAQLDGRWTGRSSPGHLSNASCYETTADAATRLQPVILITVAIVLSLSVLSGACLFLVLKYRGLVKYWFHTPPSIPLQIEEYLKDPTEPILESLDRNSAPKDDAWDSVSIVSSPEERDVSKAL